MRSKPTRSARSLRTRYIVAAFVPALILMLSVTGFVWAQKQVTVVVDGHATRVDSQAADVASLLSWAGIEASSDDLVFPARDTKVSAGMNIVVRHAISVTVVLGGAENHLKVVGTTVADALVAAGVDPAAVSGITPSIDSKLRDGDRIEVPGCFTRVSAVNGELGFKTVERPDGTLHKGARKVVRAGVAGTVMNVYRTLVINGVEGSSTLTARQVITKPIDRVVAVGTGDGTSPRQLAVARVSPKLRLALQRGAGRTVRVVATAYSAAEPGATSGTATGGHCVRGVIAVDPDVIPLGSHVYVPGYGFAIAADTGGMINGRHIDLCYDSLSDMESWGRRVVNIIVLD